MNARRRMFFTGAPLLAIPAIAFGQTKPELCGEAKTGDGAPWPTKILKIEGRDGRIHEVAAWK